MPIIAVGVSHASAPYSLRERMAVPPSALPAALARVRELSDEAFILSTCHRTELYVVAGDAAAVENQLLRALAEDSGLPEQELRSACYVLVHDAAIRHMLRVASGLDSMVLGEDQIQSQLKRALAAATEARTIGPMLDRLGSAALACGKRVRTFTELGRHQISLEALAVRAVCEHAGPLDGKHVLIIGAGDSGRLVERHVRNAGAVHVDVLGRADLREPLARADIVICCTSAPHPVVTPERLELRLRERPGTALLCVDLGMPRDVDTGVAAIPGATVLPLDALSPMVDAHRESVRRHVPAAETIVQDELSRYLEWLDLRDIAEELADIDAHVKRVVEMELARAMARLPGLGERERGIMAELAHRVARKVGHQPIVALKKVRRTGRWKLNETRGDMIEEEMA